MGLKAMQIPDIMPTSLTRFFYIWLTVQCLMLQESHCQVFRVPVSRRSQNDESTTFQMDTTNVNPLNLNSVAHYLLRGLGSLLASASNNSNSGTAAVLPTLQTGHQQLVLPKIRVHHANNQTTTPLAFLLQSISSALNYVASHTPYINFGSQNHNLPPLSPYRGGLAVNTYFNNLTNVTSLTMKDTEYSQENLTAADGNQAGQESKVAETSQIRPDENSKDIKTVPGPFLPVFSILQFPGNPCYTSNDDSGICLSDRKCRNFGGEAAGMCAHGFGVCCIYSKSCGEVIQQKVAYFRSPYYPKPFKPPIGIGGVFLSQQFECSVKIQRATKDICQIRLDLEEFETLGLNAGSCKGDAFRVIGTSNAMPIICGKNSGQHVYLELDNEVDEVDLQFSIDGTQIHKRFWNIRVTQIGCKEETLVPNGCLQYYRHIQGEIQSFNYGDTSVDTTAGYPPNLNYGICVQKQPGFCSIRYASTGIFQVDASSAESDGAQQTDHFCRSDFLLIPNSSPVVGDFTFDRFCGSEFPEAILSRTTPYVVQFVSDNTGLKDGGFHLSYEQQPC